MVFLGVYSKNALDYCGTISNIFYQEQEVGVFKIEDVMNMGIEKERKRYEFYKKLTGLYQDEKLIKLFSDLATWEEEHVSRFIEIKSTLEKEQESRESYAGELGSYIEAYLDDKLYYDIESEEFSQKVKDPDDALTIAMHFEKDAIIFFTELFNLVDDIHKPTIKTLINEEKQHLLYLYNMRKELQS